MRLAAGEAYKANKINYLTHKLGEPLLFKGNDFAQTDVLAAK